MHHIYTFEIYFVGHMKCRWAGAEEHNSKIYQKNDGWLKNAKVPREREVKPFL
jgi:hypothetical protein